MPESLEEILERRRSGGCPPSGTLGKHPDYDSWPRRAKFPVIDGEQWMLCTDGCYFVSMDRPGMLVVARENCWHKDEKGGRFCWAPIHPAEIGCRDRNGFANRQVRCRAHRR
jgi:hypothetical protein